ncbi:hypothetical protein BGZ94_007049 [Podila epigama]|nr:hypothetical protein BGZ94_007049 [Podila epigama]
MSSIEVSQNPELVLRIGLHVPLWLPSIISNREFVSSPKDLASCTQVCRLWRRVLTPLLWVMFDDHTALYLKIPKDLIDINSHHIRYLLLRPIPRESIPPVSRLKGLSLHSLRGSLEKESVILKENPDLVWLHIYDADRPAYRLLQHLTSLQHLHIESLNLDVCIRKGTLPYFWSDYPNIKKLRILLDAETITDVVDLIQQCPNIETLSFWKRDTPYAIIPPVLDPLSKVLNHNCHNLKVLKYRECNYPDFPLSTREHVNLVKATSNLVHLQLTIMEFDQSLFNALLHDNSHSLEVLDLLIHNKS